MSGIHHLVTRQKLKINLCRSRLHLLRCAALPGCRAGSPARCASAAVRCLCAQRSAGRCPRALLEATDQRITRCLSPTCLVPRRKTSLAQTHNDGSEARAVVQQRRTLECRRGLPDIQFLGRKPPQADTSVCPGVRAGRGGGDEETRTPDPLLAKEMLFQLSYVPLRPRSTERLMVGVSGLEPETSALSGQCSNQLS
jgi:hypothetical protein